MSLRYGEPERETPEDRTWVRWVGLFGLTLLTVVFAPSVLIGVPFVFLVVALPAGRGAGLLVAALALVWIMMPAASNGLWYLERAWAVLLGGWFAAITWRWPGTRFTQRGLGALAATLAMLGGYFALNPRTWELVDWLVRSRVGGDWASLFAGIKAVTAVDAATAEAFESFIALQIRLYPALIALSSFAALGVAWWWYVRLSHGRSNALGALRNFGFPDGLVWLAIAGLVLVLAGRAWATSVGVNTLFFMGALYALRGLAVVMFFKGGISVLGAVLAGTVTLFAAPVVLGAAVMIGLGDTWLGLRAGVGDILADGDG